MGYADRLIERLADQTEWCYHAKSEERVGIHVAADGESLRQRRDEETSPGLSEERAESAEEPSPGASGQQQQSSEPAWPYDGRAPAAVEPAAMSALALLAYDLPQRAQAPLDWLAQRQNRDGSLGITAKQTDPHWPTSLAMLAWWHAEQRPELAGKYQSAINRGVSWILADAGTTIEPTPELGHNPMLVGWPWVAGTHSWMEPTCWSVLALRTVGQQNHARTREGLELIVNRLLPEGGCNYGNTYVLRQKLRPHLAPTGVCLLALAGEPVNDPRVGRSVEYLRTSLDARTATMSLCFGLMGLAAFDRRPAEADAWLASAARRVLDRDPNAYHFALLALAARGSDCPLVMTNRRDA